MNDMKRLKLEYLKDEPSSYSLLLEYLQQVDHKFNPPIGSRVSLPDFARKALSSGYVIVARDADTGTTEGATIFYCTPTEYEYAFVSYIASSGSRKGVGSLLLSEIIAHCRRAGSKGIKSQTWETNEPSKALFAKFGFVITGLANNRGNDENSVLLQLDF